jgi:hypothetical protein
VFSVFFGGKQQDVSVESFQRWLAGRISTARRKGHLTANLRKAIRTDDKIPLFVLNITARAVGELATDKKTIREWFDVAHEFIVRGFTDLTTREVQRSVWEREDA